LNDEIRKKINYTKGSEKNIIKRMRVKIKVKNKLEDSPIFLIEKLN
jgi:hypothetical protein